MKYNKKKAYKLSDAEKKAAKEFVSCPIKRGTIHVALCGKMQSAHRRKCEQMNMGNGCQFIDFTNATEAWAKHLEKKVNI